MTIFTTIHPSIRRIALAATVIATMLATPVVGLAQSGAAPGVGTPTAAWSCDMTPGMGMSMSSTPMPAHSGMMEHGQYPFDQLYIDMMIPHHQSIIALAQAALPRLTDPRLKTMAESIISAQTTENAQMSAWREAWYGSPTPDLSEHSMMAMQDAMPVGTMDAMMHEMDPMTQVAAFCSAANPDLAFIEQTIPHHQMAIDVSKIALEKAEHPEIKQTAEAVIQAQHAEIDQLNAIYAELTGGPVPATPATPAG
ncbi:MAG: DUF305 domain-containing protein [Thermomicrobiales bacterium]